MSDSPASAPAGNPASPAPGSAQPAAVLRPVGPRKILEIALVPAPGGIPVRIEAYPGERYELKDPRTGRAPRQLRVWRVANDLWIALDTQAPADPSLARPDLVIGHYFDPAFVASPADSLVGLDENALLRSYLVRAESLPAGAAPGLAHRELSTLASVTTQLIEFPRLEVQPAAASLPILLPGLLAGGLAGLAGGGGGGGGGTPPPVVDTLKPGLPSLAAPEALGGLNRLEAADGTNLVISLPANAAVGDLLSTVLTRPDGSTLSLSSTLTAADLAAGQVVQAVAPTSLSAADGRWSVRSSLARGAVQGDAATLEFVVDTTAPGAPQLSLPEAPGRITAAEAQDGTTLEVTLPPGSAAGDRLEAIFTSPSGTVLTRSVVLQASEAAAGRVVLALTAAELRTGAGGSGFADGAWSVRAALTDTAGNPGVAAQASFELETRLVLQGTIVAGPVTGGLTVEVFGDQGQSLGSAAVGNDGAWRLELSGLGSYRGPVLVKVTDANGALANYLDEVSAAPRSLDTTLRAVGVAAESNPRFGVQASGVAVLELHVNPLTELAARRLVGAADRPPADAAAIAAANLAVGEAFGLRGIDVTAGAVPTNSAAFRAEDGLSGAERVGLVLAKLSGAERLDGGNLANVLGLLERGLVAQGGSLALSSATAAWIDQGRQQALAALKAAPSSAEQTFVSDSTLHRQLLGEVVVTRQEIAADGRLLVFGTALPGSRVSVSFADGTVQSATVGLDGSFVLTSSRAQASFVSPLAVTGQDALDQPVRHTAPGAPTVDIGNGRIVSGTGTPGSEVEVLDAGGRSLGKATVDPFGAWSLALATPLAADSVLQAVARDASGNISAATGARIVVGQPGLQIPEAADGFVNLAERDDGGVGLAIALPANAPAASRLEIVLTRPDGSTFTVAATLEAADIAAGSLTRALPASALGADGRHQVSVRLTTPTGVISAAATREFVLDTQAPAAPTLEVAGDRLVAGQAEPGSTVRLLSPEGKLLGNTGPVGADGGWVVRLDAALADATPLRASATDAAGNPSPLASGQVLASAVRIQGAFDDAAPGLGLLAEGSLSNDSSPLLSGTTGRTLLAGQVLALYRRTSGGEWLRLGEATVAGTGWTFQDGAGAAGTATARLADGNYAYQARIESGTTPVPGIAASAPFELQVLTAAPAAVTAVIPEARDARISAAERESQGGVPVEVSLPPNTRPGDELLLALTLPDGSVRRIAAPLSPAAALAGSLSVLLPREVLDLDGEFVLRTTVSSAVTGLSSPPATNRFTLDTAAPAAPTGGLDASSDTGVVGDGVTREVLPVLSGRSEPGSTVRLSLVRGAQTLVFTAQASAEGNWSVNTRTQAPEGASAPMPALVDGSYALSVAARDAAGNDSPASAITVRVDTAVAAPVIAPTNGFQAVTGSGEPGALLTLTQGTNVLGTARVAADGTWRVALLTPLADGTVLSATQTDVAGNTSTPDTEPVNAAVPFILPSNGRTLSGTGRAGHTLVLSVGSTTLGQVLIDAEGKWSFTPAPALANGVIVTAVDQQNGLSDSETVDAQPPAAPTAQLDAASDSGTLGDGRTRETLPVIRGSGASPGDTITVRMPATGEVLTTQVGANGSWSVKPAQALPHGSSEPVRVSASDAAGNTSAETLVTLLIDTQTTTPTLGLEPARDSGAPGDGLTRDATPAFKGTAEPGSTVRLVLALDAQRSATYTLVADATTGAWSLDTATARPDGRTLPIEPLADGPHPVSVSATDAAGNASAAASLALAIDTTVGAPVIAATNGFGAVSGSGEPGAVLTLRSPAGVLGTALVGADGSWRVALSAPVADGTVLSATQLDTAGNTSTPDTETVNANVPFIRPTNGRVITGTARPGNTVVLTTGSGTALGSVVVGADGSWSLTPPTALAHATPVTATNQQSGLSSSETVDAQPPAAPAARLDPASDSGTPGDGRTNVTTPIISGSGATPGDTISVRMPATAELLTTQVGASGSWSVKPSTALPHGTTGSAQVTATDPAGNTSTPTTVALAIDTSPPAAPTGGLDASSDTGVPGDRKTRIQTPTLSGTADTGSTVEVLLAGRTYTTVAAGGRWSLTVPASDALPDGVYRPTARAIDDAGNVANAALTVFEIDATPPGLPIVVLDPSSDTGRVGDGRTRDTTPTLRGATEPGASLLLVLNGRTYQPAVDAQGNWSFTVPDADALVDATYITQVSVTDAAGNRIVAEGTRFTIDTIAPALPRGALDPGSDSGVVGDNRTSVRTPVLSGAAEAGSTVEVTVIGAGRTVLLSTLADSTGTWKIGVREADALPNGSYSIALRSTDGAGNVSSSVGIPFEVFGATLSTPVIAQVDDDVNVTGRIEDGGTTDDARPTLRITGPSGSTVQVFDGATLLGQAQETSTGVYTFTPATNLGEGSHALTARAVDPAGNASQASTVFRVIVDTTPPAPPIVQVNGPTEVSGTVVLAAGESLSLRAGGAVFDVATATGAWAVDLRTAVPRSGSLNLAEAPFVVRAEAVDPSGNLAVAVRGTDRDDLLTLLADDLVRLLAGTQTVQGDAGLDTLALGAAGVTLDLTRVADSALAGIERIALGRNTLVLAVADVRAMAGTELTIGGESGGTLRLAGSGWSATGEVTEGGVVYAVYENDGVHVRAHTALTVTPNAAPLGLPEDDPARRPAGQAGGQSEGSAVVPEPAHPPREPSLRWSDLLDGPPVPAGATQAAGAPGAAPGTDPARGPAGMLTLQDLLHAGTPPPAPMPLPGPLPPSSEPGAAGLGLLVVPWPEHPAG